MTLGRPIVHLVIILIFSGLAIALPAPVLAQERTVEGRIIYADAANITDKEDAANLIGSCKNAGFNVLVIKDVTPVPHNGCRPPKRRRV